ncbi:MAG: SHOCT domain-containing protein [Lachnospiraceae bacterium]|nr:SHOCT domain-containing protein [Lachnospiraceae bacterium]
MKCFICGRDSVGEVCNSCTRDEQGFYNRDFQYKEGLLGRKKEDFRVNITNARISGISIVSPYENGMNSKVDNFNHWIGAVDSVGETTYNKSPAPYVHIKVPGGMDRYLIFPQLDDMNGIRNAIDKAKAAKMASPAAAPVYAAPTAPAPAPRPAAPAPAPAPAAPLDPAKQDKLNKLNALLTSGILTQAEYDAEKIKLGL